MILIVLSTRKSIWRSEATPCLNERSELRQIMIVQSV
nr:MAG TPA: hypothetical protein [Caudoviricetes sp.]